MIRPITFVQILLLSLSGCLEQTHTITLEMRDGLELRWRDKAGIEYLSFAEEQLNTTSLGGFYLRDYPQSESYKPFSCTIEESPAGIRLTGELDGEEIGLTAQLTAARDHWEVFGYIEDFTGKDRATYLEFRLPVEASGWTWWDSINSKRQVGGGTPYEQNLYPISTIAGPKTGLSLAIPPSDPCVFMAGYRDSYLWLRWAFGLSSDTQRFPSRANFRFRIFSVDAEWGFRAALERYYDWYADFYSLSPAQMRTWSPDQTWMHGGTIDPRRILDPSVIRSRGFKYMAYLNLPGRVKADYIDEAEILTDDGLRSLLERADDFHWHKDNPARGRQVILSSSLFEFDGSIIRAKTTEKEVNFPLNTSLSLLADDPTIPTHGKFMFDYIKALKTGGKIESLHVDTVGRLGRYLNYRRDHFKYTKHPLTFDRQGRVCLYNKFSIFDFFDSVRKFCRENGMRLEGAGMKIYGMKDSDPAHLALPDVERDGRFFTASLMDSGWHEGNLKKVSLTGYDFERTVIGRKSYRISSGNTYKRNPEAGPSEEEIQRALSQNTAWGMGIPICAYYFKKPGQQGYYPTHALHERDSKLWASYEPVNETIRLAGWEPVTLATADPESVICERFGSQPPFYFTVWGPEPPETVTLTIDALELELDPQNVQVEELIGNNPITVKRGSRTVSVEVPIEWNTARVIRVE